MNSGETVKIWDGNFAQTFPYENVYNPDPRQGPMIISWWFDGSYVPAFTDGMRLLFLADDHVYGIWDMNQTLPSQYHYFYYGGSGYANPFFPTTTGLSVKYVNEIIIYSDDAPPVLTSITVSSATPTVGLGETQQFTASGFDQYNDPFPVTVIWTSSSTAVGTITPVGLFTALTSGTTTITATDGLVSGTAEVTVPQAAPVLTRITVSPATPTVAVGETQQFTASGFDQYNDPFPVTVIWTSSSTAVGTITPVGLFTALTSGTPTITATDGLVSGTTEVTVPSNPTMDVLYDGTVTLTTGDTFDKVAYNSGISYTISRTTPFGALDVAATTGGFTMM